MTYIEVWCYPYPSGYQPVTQNGFGLAARPDFFTFFPECFTFFLYIPRLFMFFLGESILPILQTKYDVIWIIIVNLIIIKYFNMTYNKLQSLLPNDELHYISDSTQFFIDNQIKSKKFNNNTFILFEYTIEDFTHTTDTLTNNNIDYTIYTDSYNLDYIII
jgi:hypothetical protein